MSFLSGLLNHDGARDAHHKVYGPSSEHHKSKWSHELIAGAAGYQAVEAYEHHLKNSGEKPSHEKMKEILGGLAAVEIDKLAETKGLDWLDTKRAKEHASDQAHKVAEERYNGGCGY